MMVLWAGIAALVVLALLFIVWPLVRYRQQAGEQSQSERALQVEERLAENVRLFGEHLAELNAQLADGRIDEAQFAQLKLELERSLLADEESLRGAQRKFTHGVTRAWVFALLALVLVAAALCLYLSLGNSDDVRIQALHQAKQQAYVAAQQGGKPVTKEQSQPLIAALERKVAKEPEHIQYWFMLARNYMEQNDFTNASRAYLQIVERDKQSPMVLAEAAQALFLRDGNQVQAEAESLAQQALALAPDNTTALGLLGIAAYNRDDFLGAIKYWQQSVRILGNSESAASMAVGIERARQRYLETGGSLAELQALVDGRSVQVRVSVAPGVAASPDAFVYVYARAWQGGKMPLAITRFKLAELPRTVVLTEAMAMAPTLTLASVEQVELVARISQDGTAIAKAGDWQASMGPVALAEPGEGLSLLISSQLQGDE